MITTLRSVIKRPSLTRVSTAVSFEYEGAKEREIGAREGEKEGDSVFRL
jgi:hypothetical protein